MIERSPAMLAQRRACAAIQREQVEVRPHTTGLPGGPKTGHGDPLLRRTGRLLAILQDKHSAGSLAAFASGKVPEALSAAGPLVDAWAFYVGMLARAVTAPADALAQAQGASADGGRAEEGAPIDAGLRALASSIKGMQGLSDASAIAAAAQDIQHNIDRLVALFEQFNADYEPNQRSKKAPGQAPPEPEQGPTTAAPAKVDAPDERASGS